MGLEVEDKTDERILAREELLTERQNIKDEMTKANETVAER